MQEMLLLIQICNHWKGVNRILVKTCMCDSQPQPRNETTNVRWYLYLHILPSSFFALHGTFLDINLWAVVCSSQRTAVSRVWVAIIYENVAVSICGTNRSFWPGQEGPKKKPVNWKIFPSTKNQLSFCGTSFCVTNFSSLLTLLLQSVNSSTLLIVFEG